MDRKFFNKRSGNLEQAGERQAGSGFFEGDEGQSRGAGFGMNQTIQKAGFGTGLTL